MVLVLDVVVVLIDVVVVFVKVELVVVLLVVVVEVFVVLVELAVLLLHQESMDFGYHARQRDTGMLVSSPKALPEHSFLYFLGMPLLV